MGCTRNPSHRNTEGLGVDLACKINPISAMNAPTSLISRMVLPFALMAAGTLTFAACQTGSTGGDSEVTTASDMPADTTGTFENVDVARFQALMESSAGPLVLDVRTPDEWNQGHIAGAQLMDFNDPGFDEALKTLPTDRPVLIYCASGGRSGKTLQRLQAQGGREVYNLVGGMGAWRSAGAPVDMSNPVQP